MHQNQISEVWKHSPAIFEDLLLMLTGQSQIQLAITKYLPFVCIVKRGQLQVKCNYKDYSMKINNPGILNMVMFGLTLSYFTERRL